MFLRINEDYSKTPSVNEIANFLKKAVNELQDDSQGCCHYYLGDNLALYVGYSDGYDTDINDGDIHDIDNPSMVITAAIKVPTSDYMQTDIDYLNMPYYENGDVIDTQISVTTDDISDGFRSLADYFIKEYNSMKDLKFDDNGLIIETYLDEDDLMDIYYDDPYFEDVYYGIFEEKVKELLKEHPEVKTKEEVAELLKTYYI